ncbi:MAG: hypothetical protein WA696_07145, partial [Solirubrobacterales bacterium]
DQVRSDRPHGGGESAERSPSTDEILGRAEKLWRWPESRGGRVPPSWALGVIVALLGWRVGFHPPWIGLDPSWTAGLAMATKEGLHFGTQVVFTYGPLGFLDGSIIWFGDLGVLAFLYSAALYVGFSVALVWALRRSLPIVPSVLIAFLVIALLPLLEQSILVAVIVCLGVLERERSQRTINLLVVGGASFAALEALGKLSTGPIVALLFLVAVIGVGARWWQVLGFLGLMGAEILLLWLLAGQSLSTIPDFLENTWQVVSGYSAAMLVQEQVAAWKVVLATIAAAIVTVGLVAASAQGRYRDRRARWAATALMGIAGFAVFKEGVVRTDAGHLSLYFSTACVLWIAIPWGRARWRWLVAGSAVIAAMGVPVRPPGLSTNLNAIANVRYATDQFRTLVSGSRRAKLINGGRFGLAIGYGLDPQMLADLRGHTVAIEPWEIAVAWAYQLDWDPLPVFQNYQAYTSRLDDANAAKVESPTGPARILRENELRVFPTGDADNRYPGWDPPAQARAILCNFVPLHASARWQVLGRTSNRCSSPQLIRSVDASPGTTVPVPEPGRNEVVFVRIYGAGVSGLERLSTFLLHARTRRVVVNGAQSYRLIPGTASDGLLLWGGDRIAAGAFSHIPQARTIEVTGADGGLRFSFFRMRVRDDRSSLGR